MRRSPPVCVLTIAGSDSGGGAGIQADARTLHALGGYACTCITAVTGQNLHRVVQWSAVSPTLVAAQIEAVRKDFPIAAIKIGLLPNPSVIRAVAKSLARRPSVPIVLDPVIGSTSGTRFLSSTGIRILKQELLPLVTLITPNWPELAALSEVPVHTFTDAEMAARRLHTHSGTAVLAKGGHAPGSRCRDLLVDREGRVHWFNGRRIRTANTHGTGCVLSSAIAFSLAKNKNLAAAVNQAREFLLRCLRSKKNIDWRGRGPAFAGT